MIEEDKNRINKYIRSNILMLLVDLPIQKSACKNHKILICNIFQDNILVSIFILKLPPLCDWIILPHVMHALNILENLWTPLINLWLSMYVFPKVLLQIDRLKSNPNSNAKLFYKLYCSRSTNAIISISVVSNDPIS